MNRFTRITSILIQLQSKKIVTAKEIAEHFEVSLRTVYRDIKALQDSGVPIGSEIGVGYFIVDGYKLPPISLTEEEANSLIVSEKFIQEQGDTSLIRSYESLLFKIKATLKNYQKDKVELLSERVFTTNNKTVKHSSWLSTIQQNVSNKITLEIIYESLYKKEITKRKIEPLALYYTNNAWILIAYCHLRNDLREFRLDKIMGLNTTNEGFKKDLDFSLDTYFKNFDT